MASTLEMTSMLMMDYNFPLVASNVDLSARKPKYNPIVLMSLNVIGNAMGIKLRMKIVGPSRKDNVKI